MSRFTRELEALNSELKAEVQRIRQKNAALDRALLDLSFLYAGLEGKLYGQGKLDSLTPPCVLRQYRYGHASRGADHADARSCCAAFLHGRVNQQRCAQVLKFGFCPCNLS